MAVVAVVIAIWTLAAVYTTLKINSLAKQVVRRTRPARTVGAQMGTTLARHLAVPRMAPARLDQAGVFIEVCGGGNHGIMT